MLLQNEDAEAVNQILLRWKNKELQAPVNNGYTASIGVTQKPAPLTLLLVFLGFFGAALTAFGYDFIHLFTFWDFYTHPTSFDPWIDVANGQFWRFVTPIFLHFGAIHIIFNALWIWYLGTLIEFAQSAMRLLIVCLIIAVASNSAQAFISEDVIFGGLSGVVHGLFSYVWLFGYLNPNSAIRLPNTLFVILTALMLASTLGIFDIIVGGEIADTAHISGYITGLLLAALFTLLKPAKRTDLGS